MNSKLTDMDFEAAGRLSIPDLLDQRVIETPDAPAIRGVLGELTFREWQERAAGLAGLLGGNPGSLKGERVLLWMSNDEATLFVCALHACFIAAAVAVALDDRATPDEAGRIIAETDPRAILISPQVLRNLGQEGLDRLGAPARVSDDNPETVCVLELDRGRFNEEPASWNPDDTPGLEPAPSVATADDPSFIAYTSGSTGRPKGAIWNHAGVVQYAERATRGIYSLPRNGTNLSPADVLQSPVPLYTAASLIESLYPTAFSGCRLIFEGRKFDAAASEQRMRDFGTTVFNGAPPHFALMCDLPAAPNPDRLGLMVSGGSAFTKPLYERMRRRWPGVPIANWYGLNESGTGQTLNFGADIERDPGAIGRPVWPTECRIVQETDSGEFTEVPSGEEGELWLKGPGQMSEYFRNPEQTAKRLQDGWLRTGDHAVVEEDGLIRVVGRNEERINRGGFKFYPAELESTLEQHEAVREAAVIAVPHSVLGQDAVAFVVPVGGRSVDEDALRQHCRRLIAPNKVPSRVIARTELPRGAYGKVVKRKLEQTYRDISPDETNR